MTVLKIDRKLIDLRITGLRSNVSGVLRTLGSFLALMCAVAAVGSAAAQTPAIGSKAPDFTLETPTGSSVSLEKERVKGITVLVLLRGFPGYQCPYCVKQVHDFVEHSADFAAKKANILLIYPGPPADLDQHAKEFLAKQADLPPNIHLVIDPDYKMTNLYGLRWDAPHETAYPSTFILDKHGTILFEKASHSHGDVLQQRTFSASSKRISPSSFPSQSARWCHERSLCVKWHPSASVLKNVIAGGHGTGRTDHKLTILTAVFDNCLPSDECSIVGCQK